MSRILFALIALQLTVVHGQALDKSAVFLEFCTGTRIADKVVLTAYHCLEQLTPATATAGGVKVRVVDHMVSPLAKEIHVNVLHDVALLYLEQSLPADVPIIPLASPGQTFEKYVRLGYGYHAGPDGWVNNLTLGVLKSDLVTFYDRSPKPTGKLRFAQPPEYTCPGDSGGPTLGFDNGQWYLVGVTSRVIPDIRHRFGWILSLTEGKGIPDYAKYCGQYYTAERVTENLEFIVSGTQALIARHPEPPPPLRPIPPAAAPRKSSKSKRHQIAIGKT